MITNVTGTIMLDQLQKNLFKLQSLPDSEESLVKVSSTKPESLVKGAVEFDRDSLMTEMLSFSETSATEITS